MTKNENMIQRTQQKNAKFTNITVGAAAIWMQTTLDGALEWSIFYQSLF